MCNYWENPIDRSQVALISWTGKQLGEFWAGTEVDRCEVLVEPGNQVFTNKIWLSYTKMPV